MGDFQQYFDIILFAMVAAFLVLRLRSVLGRRTGNERRRELFVRRPQPAAEKPSSRVSQNTAGSNPAAGTANTDTVADGLNRIRQTDPSFDPPHFVEGARTAF